MIVLSTVNTNYRLDNDSNELFHIYLYTQNQLTTHSVTKNTILSILMLPRHNYIHISENLCTSFLNHQNSNIWASLSMN